MGDLSLDLLKSSPNFGDLVLSEGDLVINSGVDAIRQNVVQRLRVYLGEWFLNTQIGVPYYQQILVKNPNKGDVDGIFQNTILGTPGINSLDAYLATLDTVTRQYSVSFRATATSGTVDYSGII